MNAKVAALASLSGPAESLESASFSIKACDAADFHRRVEWGLARSRVWSRTFQGISDTSTSDEKPALARSSELLRNLVARNYRETADFLNGPHGVFRGDISSWGQIEALIERSAELVNRDLLSEQHGFYRTWMTKVARQPPPQQLPDRMEDFCRRFLAHLKEEPPDYVRLAGFFERTFNGEEHFLSDGCSRLSRVWATVLLARGGHCYPLFPNRQDFFDLIDSPAEVWEQGYRARVQQAERCFCEWASPP